MTSMATTPAGDALVQELAAANTIGRAVRVTTAFFEQLFAPAEVDRLTAGDNYSFFMAAVERLPPSWNPLRARLAFLAAEEAERGGALEEGRKAVAIGNEILSTRRPGKGLLAILDALAGWPSTPTTGAS